MITQDIPVSPLQAAVPPAAPIRPPVPATSQPRYHPPLGVILASLAIILITGILSFRIWLPMAYDLHSRFFRGPEKIIANGVTYTPFTYFLRLEEKRADVYPLSSMEFITSQNLHHLPLRGNIPGLKELVIVNNPLEELPDSIGDVSDLEKLYVIDGRLKRVPESIGNLTNLTDLKLTNNHIKKLPDSIGNLTNLQALNLAYNDLEELPPSIANLTNLEVLDLTGNKFREMPHPIPPNLLYLVIGGNRIPVHILTNATISWEEDIFY